MRAAHCKRNIIVSSYSYNARDRLTDQEALPQLYATLSSPTHHLYHSVEAPVRLFGPKHSVFRLVDAVSEVQFVADLVEDLEHQAGVLEELALSVLHDICPGRIVDRRHGNSSTSEVPLDVRQKVVFKS